MYLSGEVFNMYLSGKRLNIYLSGKGLNMYLSGEGLNTYLSGEGLKEMSGKLKYVLLHLSVALNVTISFFVLLKKPIFLSLSFLPTERCINDRDLFICPIAKSYHLILNLSIPTDPIPI